MTKRLSLLFVLFCTFFTAHSQDVHFTSFDYAPLTINPALAGAFLGTYRIGGIYRDQWRSVSSDGAFSTANLHVDMPVITGFRKQDWVGIGVNVFSDQSNTYGLRTTKTFQGLSYHLSIDKKQTQIISFGIQNNSTFRSLRTRDNINTESFIRSGTPDAAFDVSNEGSEISDWSGGAMYSQYLRNNSFIRAGLTISNFRTGNRSVGNSTENKRLHFLAFAMYDMPLRGNVFLTPQVFYQRKGNNQEILTQAKVSYLLDESKGIYVNGGLGYRWGDAANILLGFDYKDIKVQFAYDINTSGLLPATNSVGAFELGVSYIGKVYKKPKPDPTEVCPRF